jgi:hypothetical protein
VKVEITNLTPQQLAECFCEMYDEEQAQFFIEVAAIAKTWEEGRSPCLWVDQWELVGKHLRTCSCSTDEARDLVISLARGVG